MIWSADLSFRPYLIKIILDKLSSTPRAQVMSELQTPIFTYLGMSLLIIVVLRFYNILMLKMMPRLRQQATISIITYMLGHSHSYYQNYFAGALANKIQDIAKGLSELIKAVIDRFFCYAAALLIAVYTLHTVHIKFSLIMLTWSILFFAFAYTWSRRIHKVASQVSETQSQLIGRIVDILSNISLVRLFSGIAQEKSNLSFWSEETVKIEQRFEGLFFEAIFIQGLSFVGLQAINLYMLLQGFKEGSISVGDFALILTLNIQILDCLWNLSKDLLKFSDNLGKSTQGLRLTALPLEIKDIPNAKPLHIKKGEISFKNVNFQYLQNETFFVNKSITIKSGQKVGLVGYSGSGKSTFVNLILRLFDIQSGTIFIDKQNIAEVTQESLRQAISMIPQEPTLFHRSLLDNIRYGHFAATEAEVIAAAKQAHAHEFIIRLPLGYHSLVGERGVKLSGGQRQRIAIARAILKNSPILILDEATSALDSVTEQLIQESLWQLMQEKTTIVIAHRLSTLLQMDRILVFNEGNIIQDGTHDELLKEPGLYKTLWSTQMSGFLPNKKTEMPVPVAEIIP